MKLQLKALYEPLEIEIGKETVTVMVNVTADNLVRIADVCAKCKEEMAGLETLKKKAQREGNAADLNKFNARTAKAIKKAIVQAIGAEGYAEIIAACGCGHEIEEASCNVVTTHVLWAIAEIVQQYSGEQQKLQEKAAHYLAEVSHAQPKPDQQQ